MSGDPAISVEGVWKRFDGVQALRGVSLDVGAEELLVVLGPTGAGKTTLLRTVAGLETPDAGSVRLSGRDVTPLPPAQRDVALVFQNFSLYPNWTVRRNLAFGLRAPARKLTGIEIGRRVEWAAGLLKIAHLLDRRSQHLSGGEMQRVAIGRAMVRRPNAFLLDEPLSNLDAKLRESLRVELVCLQRELRRPMIFVTHDQAEALSMADRLAVLAEGRILQVGTPEDLYRRPASPQVARQLGQPAVNLIEVERSGGSWLSADGTALLPAEGAAAAPDGAERMILGVRPEDIALRGGSSAGRARVVEQRGATKVVLVRWAGAELHVTAPAAAEVRVGEEVFPRIDASRAMLWPRQSPQETAGGRPAARSVPPRAE
jgi:multiple sugar transport system ATP-binding protein